MTTQRWDVTDLQPVWDAIRRGSKRARLRLGVVVCPSDHVILECFRGASGDVWGLYSNGDYVRAGRSMSTLTHHAVNISMHVEAQDNPVLDGPMCRCAGPVSSTNTHWHPPLGTVLRALQGRGRVVADVRWSDARTAVGRPAASGTAVLRVSDVRRRP